jgi:hypothetical protein
MRYVFNIQHGLFILYIKKMNDPEQRDIPCYPRQVDAKPYGFRFFSLSDSRHTKQDPPGTRHSAQPAASSFTQYMI